MAERTYRIREFAQLAGVTVRALHHYDRVGLLKPRRTRTGYRIYCQKDLETLEQIVALKFVGLPLNKIRRLLLRSRADLSGALRDQRALLEMKKGLLDRAIAAIGHAQAALERGGQVDKLVFRQIIEVIEMQNKDDLWSNYYSEEARTKLKATWTPELQANIEREWTELFRDVEAILDQDPSGDAAQVLATRWRSLVEQFTNRDKSIEAGARAFYRDSGNWSTETKARMTPFADRRIWEFMQKALAARP